MEYTNVAKAAAFSATTFVLGGLPPAVERLPQALRSDLEKFFGADLEDVRVRVGLEPARLGAVAFAVGSELHFAPGWYRPWNSAGRELIVHEVAHVLQQRAGRVRSPVGAGVPVVYDLALEDEADRAVGAWRDGVPAPVARSGEPSGMWRGRVIQCAIYVGAERLGAHAARNRLGTRFDHVIPRTLIDQVLTRFDFGNRRFRDDGHLEAEVRDAIQDDVDAFADITILQSDAAFAQFKKIHKGEADGISLAVLKASSSKAEMLSKKELPTLKKEYAALETLRLAGLRVVPVYGSVREVNGTETMVERWINGNFVDTKLGFNQMQALAIEAAFMNVQMPGGEVPRLDQVKKEVEERFGRGVRPSLSSLHTALIDFCKIKAYLTTCYISDLQGVLELNTGRFYILDPLAVVPKKDVEPLEKLQEEKTLQVVNGVIDFLRYMITEAEKHARAKNTNRRPVPKLAPPPR